MQAYHKSDTNVEMIEVLTTISQVSARMARKLKIRAAARQSEKEPMSKMADMKQTIEELCSAATAINNAADWLYQQFSGTDDSDKQQISETAATKEEPQPELKLEDVRSVLAGKSRAGHTAEVRDLLQKYGAAKLSAIDPANYKALMKDAEAIGNGK